MLYIKLAYQIFSRATYFARKMTKHTVLVSNMIWSHLIANQD